VHSQKKTLLREFAQVAPDGLIEDAQANRFAVSLLLRVYAAKLDPRLPARFIFIHSTAH
jgi:hypothetical protein